jgi:hypothetical protein
MRVEKALGLERDLLPSSDPGMNEAMPDGMRSGAIEDLLRRRQTREASSDFDEF